MPTEEKTEHDFIVEKRMQSPIVSLEEFVLGVINERDKRYEMQFELLREHISLEGHPGVIARLARTDALLVAAKEAVQIAQTATEKRFDSVNEFRSQLSDSQLTFAKQSEMNIKFEAFDSRLTTAINTLSKNSGKDAGIAAVLNVTGVIIALIISLGSLLVMAFRH